MSEPVYIIAEAGVNHNGSIECAFELIDVAVSAGASAVKFQTFSSDLLASKSVPKAKYQKKIKGESESQYEMLKKLELSFEQHLQLKKYADDKNIDFLSTAFDDISLSFLSALNLPYYKIPSGEITNAPLLWQFGRLRKPLILSTGASSLDEIKTAIAIVLHGFLHNYEPFSMDEVWSVWANFSNRELLKSSLTLLHCTSAYPAPFEAINLNALKTISSTFEFPVGYSDHSLGKAVSIGAIALGARIIEKHFTLDRNLPGPDHFCSLEPGELKAMVEDIRSLEKAMGGFEKECQPVEIDARSSARQQLVAAREIKIGSSFAREDFTTQRCGEGVEPILMWDLLGKKSMRNYHPGEVICADNRKKG